MAFVLVVITMLYLGGLLAVFVGAAASAAVLGVLAWRGQNTWLSLMRSLLAGWQYALLARSRVRLGVAAARWGEELQDRGTKPVAARLIQALLGEDPDSLLLPENFDGLRSPRDRGFIVESTPARLLQRKLAQIDAGTIAVCGPRGAGKTTLLESCVEEAEFGILAQAPATYAPHDFLLSLSVQLCETYIEKHGYEVPEFTRLSNTRRLLRRLRARTRRLLRWSVFAVPACLALLLSLNASLQFLRSKPIPDKVFEARNNLAEAYQFAESVWQRGAAGPTVAVALICAAWWKVRHSTWLHGVASRVVQAFLYTAGVLLLITIVLTLLTDSEIAQEVRNLSPENALRAIGYIALLAAFRATQESGGSFTLGSRTIDKERFFRPLSAVMVLLIIIFVVRNPEMYALLTDAENPLRVVGITLALLLMWMSDWRLRPTEPELITQCRNHLYRLQTIQMTTAALTTGASQVLTVGSSHATSVSTVPPNFPELVADFREILGGIATEKAKSPQRVIIAIDEVDRLGSDTQALAFLSEIKAVLGVPGVHYLISVAEDVGAAFVRRGLPHRDVTDSSLDDVVYVEPATLDESREILEKRAPGLTDPYVMLAHSLSGGIPRDLLRYGRHIMEMQQKAQSDELTDISRLLILQELAETLAGFRTLLSKHRWTSDTQGTLFAFRNLVAHLRTACPCTELEMQIALEQFAHQDPVSNGDNSGTSRQLSDEAGELIDEAASYAYFSLTLLEIFSADSFDRRRHAARERGHDGDPELLAEARQELGVSPYSTRTLIQRIRAAWGLSLGRRNAYSTLVPPPRNGECPHHRRTP
ncbi:hypothetical protein [Streptomyces sp. NBC_01353]|uniref:hypothetical protein n=1 Tax=Streptomyces sp. NBC_01353 TaxID=2903835 RepID=UPI002E35CE50|nr:hypothetical protein [Streptomyces sp. NBC_01353]